MVLIFPAIPVVGTILVGVKWIVSTGFPWIIAKLVKFLPALWTVLRWVGLKTARIWSYLNFRNVFLAGLAIYVVARLLGWGDAYLEFIGRQIAYVGGLLYGYFFECETGLFWQLVVIFLDLADWVFEFLFSILPDLSGVVGEHRAAFDVVMRLVGKVDLFLPVSETLALLAAYITFVVLFLVIRWTLKLVPGMGG